MRLFSDIYSIEGIRELAIPVYEGLSDFYIKNQKTLLLEAVKNTGDKLACLMSLKHESNRSARENNKLMDVINCLSRRHSFNYSFNLINQISFQQYLNNIIPSPTIPSFFKEEYGDNLVKAILALITDKSLRRAAEKILANSDLNCDIFGYRTISKNGQSIVLGKLDNTFSSFRALAHELGHCLYEINNDYISIYGGILSELFASMFEQSLSEVFLIRNQQPLSRIAENRQYCEALIKLDRLFYMKEIADLTERNTNFPILEELCVFRPSYFTGTGMQTIYGESSTLFSYFKQITQHQNFDKLLSIFNRLIKYPQQADFQILIA